MTGATGFIGGRLVEALRRDGHRVRALVRELSRSSLAPDVELVGGDLLEPASLDGIEDGVNVVIHCAGILGKWGTPVERLFEVNVQGTLNLLERFRARPPGKLIHLSAGGVTGPLSATVVDESYDCRPATAYESTKLEAERRVLSLSREWGIPATVVRPTFTYGPGDPHKLPLFRAIGRGRYAFIGSGASVNHPVYVDDAVAGILLAVERGRDGEVYIIGGPRPVTKRELAETIADAMGVRRPRLSLPGWVAWPAAWVLEAAGRMLRFEPILTRSRVMMMADNFGYSIDKARQELGYRPQTTLGEGIARTVRSYREAGQL